jgi:hypothetical protein
MEQNMGHIFISYSHRDTDYAHGLANNLQSMGFEIWIDERLDYGSQWPHEIQKQLDSCDAFILIMSPRSFASEWVQSELQRAKRKLKPIFPLLLEGDEPWLSVESTQFYDVRGGRFPDDKFYSALRRVIAVSQNSQTLGFSKSPVKQSVPTPSTSRNRNGIVIAITVVIMFAFVVCVGAFMVFFRESLFPAAPVPITEIPTISSSPTEQATVVSTPTLLPTATSLPTATLVPPPTLAPSLVPTAAPVAISNSYTIVLYGGEPNTQRSRPLDYTITVQTVDLLEISISVPSSSSGLFFHILLDDSEIYVTESVGSISNEYTTGFIDLSPYISRGVYRLTISPEGVFGSGNVGYLSSWGGTLIVRTNVYP